MKRLISKFLAVTLIASLSACSSDESTEGSSPELSVNFNTVTSSFDAAQALDNSSSFKQAASGEFLFQDGYITLTSLEYEAETDNDSLSVQFETEGIVRIDFASGVPSPDISAIEIPSGTYEAVEIEVELYDGNDEPSVLLNGTYTSPDGVVHPVRFEFNSGETFEVEREGTIVFAENQSAIAEITFDPSVWFAGVSDEVMAEATKDTDGVIVISETQNSEIFDIVADGLDLATELEINN